MHRHFAANVLTLMIFGLVAIAVLLGWSRGQYSEPGPLSQAVCLRVAPGSTMAVVADDLAEQGAISSGFLFRSGVNYDGKSGDLKAGSFVLPAEASMKEIADIVTRGGRSNNCGTEVVWQVRVASDRVVVRGLDAQSGDYTELAAFNPADEAEAPAAYSAALEEPDARFKVQFIEGTTVWQVVEAIKAAPFMTGEVGEMPTEGTLAPDVYEVAAGADRAELIGRMQAAQDDILEAAWLVRDPQTPLKTREEALILASIVEKETGLAEERPQVASVFVNRLEQGWKLQTDPSVIYGVTEGKGPLGRGLRRSELDRATPFNTYVIEGLPPTPIANPGRGAIEAALNPAEEEYMFFVADGTGGHAFAVTNAEHNRNVAKWRAIEKERAEAAQSN